MTDLIDLDTIAALTGSRREYARDSIVKRHDFPRPSLSLSQKMRRWNRADVGRFFEAVQPVRGQPIRLRTHANPRGEFEQTDLGGRMTPAHWTAITEVKMTETQRKAMQDAIEALEKERPYLGPAPNKVVSAIAALKSALAEPAPEYKKTGWLAPKNHYAVPVLFSPYTGEPRDVRDVQSDPQGILIVPPGKVEMLAAPVRETAPEPVATITSVDEYGPLLGWHTHWAQFPVGTKFYTDAPVRKPSQMLTEVRATVAAPVREPCAELVEYILQDDIHNRLTPRVVDIAYSAFMIAKHGKNKDDGGPCDWFNDTKPMVMEQLAKIKKDMAEESLTIRQKAGL